MAKEKPTLYALSTCSHCKSTKRLFSECDVEYNYIEVDDLEGEERKAILEDIKQINPRCSFPTIKINDTVIVGFKEKLIKEALGMTDDVEKLYSGLKKSQEANGYFFNKDKDLVFELLDSLLKNKDRYGYMACPCRLACDDREKDSDIICPCSYREPDVTEYGACFCGLYVSRALNNGEIEADYVPERRPAEKYV